MAELKFTHHLDHPGVFVAGLVATIVVVTILGYLTKRALNQMTSVVEREIARDAAL